MTPRRVVVAGAGVIGASIAWHLRRARPDVEVCLLDPHLPVIGASAYSAGILRRHHTSSGDVELAARSIEAYRRFRETLGGDCGYTPTGFLLLLAPEFAGTARERQSCLDAAGSATEFLDAAQLRARWPQLSIQEGEVGVLEHDGGYGSAPATTAAYRSALQAEGGRLMLGVRVDGLEPRAGGPRWRLGTNIGPVDADEVVLASGAEVGQLTAPLGLALPVTPRRIGLAVIDGPRPWDPTLPVVIDDVTGTYFVPSTDGRTAVGVRARPTCTQVLPAEPLSEDEITKALQRGARRVPGFADADVVGSQASCDGYTPDYRPILGPLTDFAGLHVACGFSGGGYKIAPAVGSAVAAGVLDGPGNDVLTEYRLERFADSGSDTPRRAYVHV